MQDADGYLAGGASAAAIQYHYDVPVAFYRLWLDQTLTYSCALWSNEGDTLEQAQTAKLDFHARNVGLREDSFVLDVGCGWGGFLNYAVSRRMRGGVGLSLSNSQVGYCRNLLPDSVVVKLEGWEAHVPAEPYDGIVSIGAFEHFCVPHLSCSEKVARYREFFKSCHAWSKSGSQLSLQTIIYDNSQRQMPGQFVEQHIFPESDAPTIHEFALACRGYYEILELRNDRNDYVKTCRQWLSRLSAKAEPAQEIVGKDVYDKYVTYLKLAIFGFHSGRIGLIRVRLRRNDIRMLQDGR